MTNAMPMDLGKELIEILRRYVNFKDAHSHLVAMGQGADLFDLIVRLERNTRTLVGLLIDKGLVTESDWEECCQEADAQVQVDSALAPESDLRRKMREIVAKAAAELEQAEREWNKDKTTTS